MIAVKICGLTRTGDAAQSVGAGAAYVGAIMAGGPRVLTLDQVRTVLGLRRHEVQRVVVFGDHHPDDVIVTVQKLDLDIAQLHGACTPATIDAIRRATGRAVWPVLRIADTLLPEQAAVLSVDSRLIGPTASGAVEQIEVPRFFKGTSMLAAEITICIRRSF